MACKPFLYPWLCCNDTTVVPLYPDFCTCHAIHWFRCCVPWIGTKWRFVLLSYISFLTILFIAVTLDPLKPQMWDLYMLFVHCPIYLWMMLCNLQFSVTNLLHYFLSLTWNCLHVHLTYCSFVLTVKSILDHSASFGKKKPLHYFEKLWLEVCLSPWCSYQWLVCTPLLVPSYYS